MGKKAIVFDLDDTLAASKSAITDEMSELLGSLLENFYVGVISGGKFEQFEKQLIANLKVDHVHLEKLHLMPTCGTRYDRFDDINKNWKKLYAEDFTDGEKKKIIKALEDAAKELGHWESKTWGEIIEDRGSQITLSALGQEAPVAEKEQWDPDQTKKQAIRDLAAERIPEFEVRVGGTTSIDVTKLGIDKAYGLEKFMGELEISKDEILFVGDRLEEGGNDYPVKAMGIACVEVDGYRDTPRVIQTILALNG